MNLFTSRKGLWRRVNGTLFVKFVNNVYKKVLCANLRLYRKVLRSLSCLFLSKVNHSLYRFPPRFGSILGAYWYTNVGTACSFLFGTMIVPSLGLFRYIIVPFLGICFSVPLLVQEMYQNKPQSGTLSAQKNGRLSAARRFSILFWNYIPFSVNAFWVLPSHIWSEILRSTSWYLLRQRPSSQR